MSIQIADTKMSGIQIVILTWMAVMHMLSVLGQPDTQDHQSHQNMVLS